MCHMTVGYVGRSPPGWSPTLGQRLWEYLGSSDMWNSNATGPVRTGKLSECTDFHRRVSVER